MIEYTRHIIEGEKADFDGILSPETLQLRVGAEVMVTSTVSRVEGVVNGARGRVVAFDNGFPVVFFNSGVTKTIFNTVAFLLLENFSISFRVHIRMIYFLQEIKQGISRARVLPLVLSWGITVHKVMIIKLSLQNCESKF